MSAPAVERPMKMRTQDRWPEARKQAIGKRLRWVCATLTRAAARNSRPRWDELSAARRMKSNHRSGRDMREVLGTWRIPPRMRPSLAFRRPRYGKIGIADAGTCRPRVCDFLFRYSTPNPSQRLIINQ